tara:strand:+ start:124 stop:702 length:579 start_codon:yes stop_codon:yes gene_type:complete
MIQNLMLVLIIITTPLAHATPPNNFHAYFGATKGAVPGFAKKPVYFNEDLAEQQLRYLYNNQKVRLVISLDHCKDMTELVDRLNSQYPGIDMVHMCRKVRRSKKHYDRNISLFKEVASFIGNETFYIHCRYGAHRAVTVLTGAWVAHGKLSFEEAFKRAGGKNRAFRSKGQKELINQARKFAKQTNGGNNEK